MPQGTPAIGSHPLLKSRRRSVHSLIHRIWLAVRSEKGQSLVEYALVLALVAIVVISALTALGSHASNAMNEVAAEMGSAV